MRSVIFSDSEASALVKEKLKMLESQNFKVGSTIENYYSLCSVDDGLFYIMFINYFLETYSKAHFLLLADKTIANTKYSSLPLFKAGTTELADNRQYLQEKFDEFELLLDYLHYNNIVHDCAWNPFVQDNPAEEEKKSKKKAKQEKKICDHNEHFEQNVCSL